MLSITDVYLSPRKQWPPRRQVLQRIHPLFVTISQPPSLAVLPYSPERSLAENYLLAAVSRHPTLSAPAPGLALGAGLCVIDSIRFGFLEEILRGDRSVSAAGRWTAAAAGCPCDLTMCVNQARVAARPASLISISLQITPRRHCKVGKAITASQNNHPPQLSFFGFHLLRR